MSNRKKITEEAADWCMLIESEQATDDDVSAFMSWLELSPLHQVEYDAVRSLWNDGAEMIDVYRQDINRLDELEQNTPLPDTMEIQPRFSKKRVGTIAAAAAVFVALSVSVLWNSADLNDAIISERVLSASYHTEKGESNRIRLTDGSYVHLNTQSDILVQFSDSERSIVLHSGEAFFDVKKDPDRPFVVTTGGATIRALGTKFSVENFPGSDFAVTVTEGKVLLTSSTRGQDASTSVSQINLTVGETIRLSELDPLTETAIEKVDLDKALMWRTGKLLFEKVPLSSVVTDFNRHNEKVIEIVDPSLNDHLISGYFDAHDPEGFLSVVEKLIAVRIVSISENEIKLLKK